MHQKNSSKKPKVYFAFENRLIHCLILTYNVKNLMMPSTWYKDDLSWTLNDLKRLTCIPVMWIFVFIM